MAARREGATAVVVSGDVYDRSVPSAEAVQLLDETVAAFAAADVPLILISGNHDSPIRLRRYGGALFAQGGVHVRTDLAQVSEPVILPDEFGEVAFYGIPYLEPDAVRERLGAERSHESVLRAAADLARTDAADRGISGPSSPHTRFHHRW